MAKINSFTAPKGRIEVICGPMFSGKTEELIHRLNRLNYCDAHYLLFTPKIDTRSPKYAASRNGKKLLSIIVSNSNEIIRYIENIKEKIDVIAIDEAQFFDKNLSVVCNYLANKKYIVIVSGLDMDFKGKPFSTMKELLIIAEEVTKLKAICSICGAKASFTERTNINSKKQIVIGDKKIYSARCRHCHSLSKKMDFPK